MSNLLRLIARSIQSAGNSGGGGHAGLHAWLKPMLLLAIVLLCGPEVFVAADLIALLDLFGALLFLSAFATGYRMLGLTMLEQLRGLFLPESWMELVRLRGRPAFVAQGAVLIGTHAVRVIGFASVALLGLIWTVRSATAAELSTEQAATAKWIVAQAKAWADQACGGKWVITDILADDFHGTSPKGTRYGKPTGEPENDPNTKWHKDCRLDEADVRFFGPDVAVVYGVESKTVPLPDSKEERRCLAWTDTWMRRNGKWQIIAVQDNRVDCPK